MIQSKLKRNYNNLDWFQYCLVQYRNFTNKHYLDVSSFHSTNNNHSPNFRNGVLNVQFVHTNRQI